ncbi:alpha/beta hydrolase [Arthrobacter sp. NPDC056493]|uniref:alpha/beta hydrolase n=1 Tax=Arthrobacter sp. NPDC056493 TaxID=3345839 RepID=UPI00366B0AE6
MKTLNASIKLDFPVHTDDGTAATFAGHLYRAEGRRRGILQVLVHGVTYDHRYWDAGRINGMDYSYAGYMTARGYDILAIDLPGTGASTRPDGDSVSFDYVASALAQGVTRVREFLGGHDLVALVGHSMGTYLLVHTQARWPVADFFVSTGTGYSSADLPSPHGPGTRERALLEPYSTLAPADRARVFYYPPATDPEVIAYDNSTLRTSIPRRIWKDSIRYRADPEEAGLMKLTCPVLIQLGEHDPVLPGRFLETERQQWPLNSLVLTDQVEGMGHSLNLHRNPERGWTSIDKFLQN